MTPPRLTACGRDIPLRAPLVMGVVNATPDSFSDAGLHRTPAEQVEHGLELLRQGADILDVGGLSANTATATIPPDEEIARVVPVIAGLRDGGAELISVDTWRSEVAAAAIDAGASIVNDISGLHDERTAELCARTGAALVLMHTRAAPKTRVVDLAYDDVVGDVRSFLEDALARARSHGVAAEQTILDPGPDFSKSPAETVDVLRALPQLASLGRPLLLALSRKDFIGAVTQRPPRERSAGTLAAIGHGVDAARASILRVHEVSATVDYLRVRDVLRGALEVPAELRLAEGLQRETRATRTGAARPGPDGAPPPG